jgi:hypothetical protein
MSCATGASAAIAFTRSTPTLHPGAGVELEVFRDRSVEHEAALRDGPDPRTASRRRSGSSPPRPRALRQGSGRFQ